MSRFSEKNINNVEAHDRYCSGLFRGFVLNNANS